LISGIWHGASWTFVVWGMLHGLYMIIGALKDKILAASKISKQVLNSRLVSLTNVIITFHLTLFAWIFFRAKNISTAFIVIKNIFAGSFNFTAFKDSLTALTFHQNALGNTSFLVGLVVFFLAIDPAMDRLSKNKTSIQKPTYKIAVYSALVAGIVIFGFFGKIQFIYFQF
jgi:hypothetical protein